jgi:hypothetical protein
LKLVFGEDGQSIGMAVAATFRGPREEAANQKGDEEEAKGGTEDRD